MKFDADTIRVIETADRYSFSRAQQISRGNSRFKIGAADFKCEMATAVIFGELSALERVVAQLVSDKQMTREDIEAQLHLAIVELYNVIGPRLYDRGRPVKLEDYLSLRGYYGKTAGSAVVETQ